MINSGQQHGLAGAQRICATATGAASC